MGLILSIGPPPPFLDRSKSVLRGFREQSGKVRPEPFLPHHSTTTEAAAVRLFTCGKAMQINGSSPGRRISSRFSPLNILGARVGVDISYRE